jgi:putative ABC transport system permease protein
VVAQFAILVLLMIVIATVWRQTRLAFDNALRLRGDQVLLINGRPICGTAFEDQVRALPGVRAAVCSANVVFSNNGAEGAALAHDGRSLPIELGPVEAGFFEFYGLHPIAGRVFDARRPGDQPLIHGPDAEASPPVVLNATAARRMGFVTPQSAVGRSIRWDRRHVWFSDGEFHAKVLHNQNAEVLGVVPDYGGTSRSAVKPMIYWVDPQLMATLSVKVSGSAAPGLLADVNRIWRAAGHFRAADTQFFDEKVRKAYRDVLVLGEVVAACAGLALALACIGLFGLASYTTERRTKEFGIRKAMGAGTADIAALLIWQFSKPVLLACAIAAPAGYVAMHWWLQGFADRVALTPASFVAVFAVTLIIAWATVLTHAWRVACTRPVTALRYE